MFFYSMVNLMSRCCGKSHRKRGTRKVYKMSTWSAWSMMKWMNQPASHMMEKHRSVKHVKPLPACHIYRDKMRKGWCNKYTLPASVWDLGPYLLFKNCRCSFFDVSSHPTCGGLFRKKHPPQPSTATGWEVSRWLLQIGFNRSDVVTHRGQNFIHLQWPEQGSSR